MTAELRQVQIAAALRALVARIYDDCMGAYGSQDGDGYAGRYEQEIMDVARAVAGPETWTAEEAP